MRESGQTMKMNILLSPRKPAQCPQEHRGIAPPVSARHASSSQLMRLIGSCRVARSLHNNILHLVALCTSLRVDLITQYNFRVEFLADGTDLGGLAQHTAAPETAFSMCMLTLCPVCRTLLR
jgi:hypothetical protein